MKCTSIFLLFCVCAASIAAQVQPNLVPGLPGIGVAYGLDSSAQIESILVYQNGQQVQALSICTAEHIPNTSPLGAINMADLNFDGYYDILLQVASKDDNQKFCVWLYNPETQRLDASPALSALVNPRPNAKDRTVTSFLNMGCQGGCHETRTFRWIEGQLHLVRVATQTQMQLAPVSGPGCLYMLTVQEERKGKMVQVSSDPVNSMGSKICN